MALLHSSLYQANSCHDGEKVWAEERTFLSEIRKALTKANLDTGESRSKPRQLRRAIHCFGKAYRLQLTGRKGRDKTVASIDSDIPNTQTGEE
jgi:hypothetical protein